MHNTGHILMRLKPHYNREHNDRLLTDEAYQKSVSLRDYECLLVSSGVDDIAGSRINTVSCVLTSAGLDHTIFLRIRFGQSLSVPLMAPLTAYSNCRQLVYGFVLQNLATMFLPLS